MLSNGVAVTSAYTLDILTDILSYVQSGLNWVATQAQWLQLVIWAGAAIFIIIGLFTFLKKAIKVFFVLAIIAGIVYVLDMQNIIDIQGLLGQFTGAFSLLFM